MDNIFSQKLRSDMNDWIWVYNQYLLAIVQRTLYIVLLLAGGVGVAASAPLPMPDSEVSYPGASATSAFVAKEPYVVKIQGVNTTIPLWGASRRADYSGNAPFVNTGTGRADPRQIQAWDPVFAKSFNPDLSGSSNLNDDMITNAGFPGRVDKRTLNGDVVTMVRYNAGNGTTEGNCRSQLNAYHVPPRTHVRWELEVAFGNADGVNDWYLSPTYASPVLFWQLHSKNQSNPALSASVDTDPNDRTKLMITFSQRVGTATAPKEIGRVNGIPRNTMVPIVIEAFLDERSTAKGGKGLLQIWLNNALVVEKAAPTLALGTNPHWWTMDMYLWAESSPYSHTRASFWKTARMMVFPVGTGTGTTDTTPPSAPTNLAATAPDSTKVNLSWSASTDNVSVAGYSIYRDGTKIDTSAGTNFTDTTVFAGVTYSYTVKAWDGANNYSDLSNTATVQIPTGTGTADTIPPSAPANLVATTPNTATVNLSWSASTDNVSVLDYSIYRDGTKIGTNTGTNFTDTTVVAEATYSYRVKAWDDADNYSDLSNTATVQIPPSDPSDPPVPPVSPVPPVVKGSIPMPDSEVSYPGASATSAFVAQEPYVVKIQGFNTTVPLWGASRRADYSGNVPFVNPGTGESDIAQIQAWDPVFAQSFTPDLSGSSNLNDDQITNAGFPGRVDKRTLNGEPVTMTKYNAGDGVTNSACRSRLKSFPVPPRTHVRWELDVAFGAADGKNDWFLTPFDTSPVVFWALTSPDQANGPLYLQVDTDSLDSTKLEISISQRVGPTPNSYNKIGVVHGLARHTLIPIAIEAFLDERATANGGKGLLQIWVNNALVLEKAGPTLALGPSPQYWSMNANLWNEPYPSSHTRAAFWKTARMMVFP